jgi:hypothetical protein
MEVVPSNFVGRGKGVLKGGPNDNMNAQQCQTNWEYSEVHAFIKCKEVEYIAQKELVNPRTHMVPIAHKNGQRF